MEEFNLHTIIRLPESVFSPYTKITTNILCFDKTGPTKETWFYRFDIPEGYKAFSKTKPVELKHLEEVISWWNDRKESDVSWKVDIQTIKKYNYDLDINNPNQKEEIVEYNSSELMKMLEESFSNSNELLEKIKVKVK